MGEECKKEKRSGQSRVKWDEEEANPDQLLLFKAERRMPEKMVRQEASTLLLLGCHHLSHTKKNYLPKRDAIKLTGRLSRGPFL